MKALKEIKQHQQTREFGIKIVGNGPKKLFFVQMNEDYAVGSDGCIYQIIYDNELEMEEGVAYVAYQGNDCIYNYAEDSVKDLDEDSIEIYNHCFAQAEELYWV